MDRIRGWLGRLGYYFRRARFERELDQELEFHVAMRARDLMAGGVGPEPARAGARRRLGSAALFRDETRDVWRIRWIEALGRDLRLAGRGLLRAPGFAGVAIATLALGIGGTTAFFSLIYTVLLEPLPYPDPKSLVTLQIVSRVDGTTGRLPWSYPMFDLLRRNARGFDRVAGFAAIDVNLRGTEQPERVLAETVSAGYFPLLGARAAAGRLFAAGEDSVADGAPVVVLADRLWRRRFGGSPGVVGQTITLGSTRFTVIGVMAPGFVSMSGPVDVWVPLTMAAAVNYTGILEEKGNHWVSAAARIGPNGSFPGAVAELERVGALVDREFRTPGRTAPWSAIAEPLLDLRVDPAVRQATLVLFGAVAFVLLIACANVAGLLLVRASGRRRELAVRSALGAGRGAIVRQLLAEAGLLGVLGGVAGVLVAGLVIRAVAAFPVPGSATAGGLGYLVDYQSARLGWPVLAFALLASVLAALAIGLLPARDATRASAVRELRDRGGRFRQSTRARQMLVGVEAALATVLLIGAGLMLQSFARLNGADRGFVAANVLTFRVAPGEQDEAARRPMTFKARAIDALRAIPGVTSAGVNTCTPLSQTCSASILTRVDERRLGEGGSLVQIGVHSVSPDYFKTLGIPLLDGRTFDRSENSPGPRVVLVNRTTARRFWPNQSAVGHQLAVATGYFSGGDSLATVIGVVADVRYGVAERPADFDVYLPALQRSFGGGEFFVATSGPPLGIETAVRAAIRGVDPELPIFAVRPMEEIAAAATARTRLATWLLMLFSGSAVLLAAIGVYGVISYAVASRRQEIGIRLAVGAGTGRVVMLMLRQGIGPIAGGLAVGTLVAIGVTRVLRGMLFEVDPGEPVAYVAAVVVLGMVAFVASWLPALRAARVPPTVALRSDG